MPTTKLLAAPVSAGELDAAIPLRSRAGSLERWGSILAQRRAGLCGADHAGRGTTFAGGWCEFRCDLE
jgi:hypothetical protein